MQESSWITIPASRFRMGSNPRDAAPPSPDEFPLHLVDLPAYRLARTPVTNKQYFRFVSESRIEAPAHWEGSSVPLRLEQMPVTYVSWRDALAFCEWAGCRLPSEAEWEKGARGPATFSDPEHSEPRLWPWGDDLPDGIRCQFDQQRLGVSPAEQHVVPVGMFPAGASPYGLLDMAGNVWEWTSSAYAPYPYPDSVDRLAAPDSMVLRGGSYNHNAVGIRCAARTPLSPGARDVYIGFRVAADPDSTPILDFDLIDIPAGPFWMGSKPSKRQCIVMQDELPEHEVELGAFDIGRFPVSNQEYNAFVRDTGHLAPPHWKDRRPPSGLEQHPVTFVDWQDALAYCQWAGGRLPTEAEWERTAAGVENRLYPWGDEPPDESRLRIASAGQQITTTEVGSFPAGATPEGVMDLAGNVWEWVQSRYSAYPYNHFDGREEIASGGKRVLRGGSFLSPSAAFVRCAMRSLSFESRRREHIGFRVARSR